MGRSMSEMGHKRRFRLQSAMSALPPKASKKADMGVRGAESSLSPRPLDFDLFRYGQSIVDIDAQISHRAFNFRVSEQKLNGPQISGSAVDQCCLGPS